MVAGLSPSRLDRESIRDPTGSPVVIKVSTIAVRISRSRSPIGAPEDMLPLYTPFATQPESDSSVQSGLEWPSIIRQSLCKQSLINVAGRTSRTGTPLFYRLRN